MGRVKKSANERRAAKNAYKRRYNARPEVRKRINEHRRQRYAEDSEFREMVKEIHSDYVDKNRERINEYNREWKKRRILVGDE